MLRVRARVAPNRRGSFGPGLCRRHAWHLRDAAGDLSVWLSSLSVQATSRLAVAVAQGSETDFGMIKDLPVLENFDVLSNFDALSDLPCPAGERSPAR